MQKRLVWRAPVAFALLVACSWSTLDPRLETVGALETASTTADSAATPGSMAAARRPLADDKLGGVQGSNHLTSGAGHDTFYVVSLAANASNDFDAANDTLVTNSGNSDNDGPPGT